MQNNLSALYFLYEEKLIDRAHVSYAILVDAYSGENIFINLVEQGFIKYDNLLIGLAKYLRCKVFSPNELQNYILSDQSDSSINLLEGYILIKNINTLRQELIISNLDIQFIQYIANAYPNLPFSLAGNNVLYAFVTKQSLPSHTFHSIDFLDFVHNNTARAVHYKLIVLISACINISAYVFLQNLFVCVHIIILGLHNFFKGLIILNAFKENKYNAHLVQYCINYPKYSVLIPLYKEKEVKSIINALSCIIYPKHKLQVNLLLEEGDRITIEAIKKINLPYYINILFIAKGYVKTKPKALNFAMPYVIGDYLVVYDAEDVPDPMQLIIAHNALKALPMNYIGVQAKLKFYNSGYNLLTSFMAIEYAILFRLILVGMFRMKITFPLGGTSNHFKTHLLREIGCWDAFNVTEDAELGIRISMYGYKMGIIDSYTEEEAPVEVKTWVKQRSRWIKGYWQTFFTFCKVQQKYKLKDILSVYLYIGFGTYAFLFQPFLIIMLFFNKTYYLKNLFFIGYLSLLAFVLPTAIYGACKVFYKKISIYKILFISILYPFYFFLHSLASLIAVYELCTLPFFWHKTTHTLDQTRK
jgi:cellulose synthase/poly-beta-1,6-N-acetylglucosamine synthase-like glycosyltransferase